MVIITTVKPKASHTFSGTCNLLRNLLRNPVEPDLALHQSLPLVPAKMLVGNVHEAWYESKKLTNSFALDMPT